jgi:hypothetical protein
MAWAIVAGAAISVVGGSLLADDNGAEAANGAAADANALQAQIARDQWNRYKEIYEPLERTMVDEASNYDSAENYAKAAGDASATVSQQFSKARDRLTRTTGLDPSSGAYQSSLVGLDMAQAASDATQQNAARQKVTDTAYARQTDALSLGKGLPAQAGSALATSASSNLSLAQAGNQQANSQAAALGRITDRIISTPTVSNWLNGTSTTTKPATQVDTNSYFDSGTMTA